MSASFRDLSLTTKEEMVWLLCGDPIGQGSARYVYECRIIPNAVVKVEDCAGAFQNAQEWNMWRYVHGTSWERWFAPCLHVSHSAGILIQARTQPLPDDRYPKKLPCFLTDTQRCNYGLYEGRFVAHDYGLVVLPTAAEQKRRVEWR